MDILVSRAAGLSLVGHVGSEASDAADCGAGPGTAPLSVEDRQQAVTALAVMIDQWWSARDRSADGGSDRYDDAVATDR